MPKTSKMMQMVNCRIRVTLTDSRVMVGQLLAFDKHMNLVMVDCEEFRMTKKQQKQAKGLKLDSSVLGDMRRTLGMILLRGETIVSMIPESGPPPMGGNKARVPAARQMAPNVRPMMPMGVPPPGAPPAGFSGPPPGMFGTVPPSMPPPGMFPPGHYPPPPNPPK